MNAMSSVPDTVTQLAGDQRRVIGERRREEQARRDAQDVLVRLKRHQEDPEDREQEEDHDQRNERRRELSRSARDVCSMIGLAPQASPRARSRSFSHCLMKTFDSA